METLKVTEIPDARAIRRSSSILSSMGGGSHRKWTITTQELNSNIMDEERAKFRVYEYLCHVGETKEWMERLLKKELAPISGFENQLQYGITIAELARLFSPGSVKKIFESDKLQFRHSDNINYFFDALKSIQFPDIFFFELTDCYEKKNMPKVIYCLHGLSHVLEMKGYGRAVRDLVGQLEFTDSEIQVQYDALKEKNINLPTFNNIENKLQEELEKSIPNLNYEELKKSHECVLDDFVPGKNFYRKESEITNNKIIDEPLQKKLFKNQANERERGYSVDKKSSVEVPINNKPEENNNTNKDKSVTEDKPLEETIKIEYVPLDENLKIESIKEENEMRSINGSRNLLNETNDRSIVINESKNLLNKKNVITNEDCVQTVSSNKENVVTSNDYVQTDSSNKENVVTSNDYVQTDSSNKENVVTSNDYVQTDSSNKENVVTNNEYVQTDALNKENIATNNEYVQTDSLNKENIATNNEYVQTDSLNKENVVTNNEYVQTDNNDGDVLNKGNETKDKSINLLNKENITNDKCIQTDNKGDSLTNMLKDHKNWLILLAVVTVAHLIISRRKN